MFSNYDTLIYFFESECLVFGVWFRFHKGQLQLRNNLRLAVSFVANY